jgi:hypothetical protein
MLPENNKQNTLPDAHQEKADQLASFFLMQ